MALSGQLSDLSLAELIEFFCNQRKTGRLKVAYERTPGYFYFDRGDLVDAKVGSLSGVEAIYYALTLANASFKFSAAFEAARRTIHQPWTQVTLEGLRRLDEGIMPKDPFAEADPHLVTDEPGEMEEEETEKADTFVRDSSTLPLSLTVDNAGSSGRRSKAAFAAVGLAVVAIIGVIGVPAGWYTKGRAAEAATVAASPGPEAQAAATSEASQPEPSAAEQPAAETGTNEAMPTEDPSALAARRAREARAKLAAAARQQAGAPSTLPAAEGAAVKKVDPPKAAPKMISVQVTYDEAGRVTQTSGGDSTAQRIARQKRFPTGKAGTTTITIPIN